MVINRIYVFIIIRFFIDLVMLLIRVGYIYKSKLYYFVYKNVKY